MDRLLMDRLLMDGGRIFRPAAPQTHVMRKAIRRPYADHTPIIPAISRRPLKTRGRWAM